MSTPERMAYVATAPCGCVHAVTVDDPEYRRFVAEDLARWINAGSTVQRGTVEQAKEMLKADCPHEPKWGRA